MPKFTPGPWAVGEWAVGNKALDVFSRSADCSIADMASANSDEELLANARLIAAAPDMYDATVSLWHVLNFFRAVFPEDIHKDLPEKISNVEKLLARIDGNSEQKGGEA